ncbi:Cytoplasmic axial filament protein CafA and Ribonuclease G [Altererythrobacter epoxidivorans]|uniref:Ribonuclease E n=1 Tax=Altererythrobacter epoxidivorans TaxID=361183 RepID=A0A0M4LV27_9SPHN|nr:ribonuclease E/G [Altererythrobacter epoxidivorans]ALE16571.1 Cytoplasmic axial filament protein CafA and Ribonuclease G [Altererythrobacter epoxidivorans]
MATRMLIDARHPEETRVAVLKGNRIEEFDFESSEHKQIKGNIYLAKVTRVEPSLQAAFVDFGGNRHGFLAFSEIHPDYYQIPQSDRDALLAEEAEAAEEEARLRAEEEERGEMPGDEYDAESEESAEALVEDLAEDGLEEIDTSEKDRVATIEDGHVDGNGDDEDEDEDDSDEENGDDSRKSGRGRRGRGRRQGRGKSRAKEVDEVRARRLALRRRYKIQDVIHRRQVLLVQVVKEERGNKGAALTTYLSLAGRYTVLMPNSSHGGGISRKISSASDRKRLKQIVGDLSLPKTMGLIVRTAGLSRTKTEIKRDFDYLARLWDGIREKTLASAAPTLIHSDSDLIKRAIRDIYNRDIEEVVVEGEEGYKSAKQFMKLLMPSHARRVKPYSDPMPLFQRYGAEDQLRAMYDPVVQLKSGGYLVINPTEALVSIDINSGRSTKEHGIEQTAVATNVEAAKEIARQLRLRDMAGLVVIDFIDMEYNSNTRKVEKAMKDALKHDRARIQVGRISGFGLMEMSRQRLRTGVLEATTRDCPHCDGTGLVRTASSAGLSALRLIEDEAAKGKGTIIRLGASTEAAIYLLNSKRADLAEIEDRYNVTVEVVPEGEDEGAKMTVTSMGPRPSSAPKFEPIVEDDDDDDDIIDDETDEDDREEREDRDDDDDGSKKKRRRRRRGGRGRNKNRGEDQGDESSNDDADEEQDESRSNGDSDTDEDGAPKKKRRRSRGGRRRRKNREDGETADNAETVEDAVEASADKAEDIAEKVTDDIAVVGAASDDAEATDEKPKRKRAPRKKKAADESEAVQAEPAETGEASEEPAEKPKRKRAPRKRKVEEAAEEVKEQLTDDISVTATTEAPSDTGDEAEAAPKKKPARKRAPAKSKAKAADGSEEKAEASDAPKVKPAAKSETPTDGGDGSDDGKPRRGWWQRTFGE